MNKPINNNNVVVARGGVGFGNAGVNLQAVVAAAAGIKSNNNNKRSAAAAKLDDVTVFTAYEYLTSYYKNYRCKNIDQLKPLYEDSLISYYKSSNAKTDLLYSVIVVPSISVVVNSNYMDHVQKIYKKNSIAELAEHIKSNKIFLAILNMSMTNINTQYQEMSEIYARESTAYIGLIEKLNQMVEPHNYKLNLLRPNDFSDNHAIENFIKKLNI